jgi:hypothetical protein
MGVLDLTVGWHEFEEAAAVGRTHVVKDFVGQTQRWETGSRHG